MDVNTVEKASGIVNQIKWCEADVVSMSELLHDLETSRARRTDYIATAKIALLNNYFADIPITAIEQIAKDIIKSKEAQINDLKRELDKL